MVGGVLFSFKKKLLSKAALKAEKKKAVKEAMARIESNELKQLEALKARISKAKNINIPNNLKAEISRRKATKKKLLKQAGITLKVGARSLKTIGKELNKLNNAKKTIKKKKVNRRKKK